MLIIFIKSLKMILIIDGYNFLKNTQKTLYVSETVRNEFINKLNSYSRSKSHKSIVVFDGGDFSFPTKETIKDVLVIYSGYKKSADEVIKDYLQEHRDKDILLISSDRDLQKFAGLLNLDFISVQEFYNIFFYQKTFDEEAVVSDDTLYKTTGRNTPELDDLMAREMGRILKKEEDNFNMDVNKNIASDKVPKTQKRLFQKIKKL